MIVNNTWKYFFTIVISFFLFSYTILDEEPVFDLSDLNLFHLIWLVLSVTSIFFDNYSRVSLGQYSDKDRSLFTYLISYVLNLLLYFVVIWFIFFLHVLSPLSLNLTDDSNPMFGLVGIFSPIMFKNFFALSVLWLTAFIFSKNQNSTHMTKFLGFLNFIVCVLLVYWTIDFTTTQVTSSKSLFLNNMDSSLVKNKSSVTYSDDSFISGFEWHLTSSKGHLIGFIDFASILVWFLFLVWFILYFIFLMLTYLVSVDVNNVYVWKGNVIGFFLTMISVLFVVYVLIFIVFFSYWFFLIITTCGIY